MDTWLTVSEFAQLVHLDESTVRQLVTDGNIRSKEEDGIIYVEAAGGNNSIVAKDGGELIAQDEFDAYGGTNFVEKTIGTILSLHEKVLEAKDETLSTLRNENQFLKDALFSMQEIYDDDKKTVDTLREQLKIAQEELEFMKRKYRLMWGKVAEKTGEQPTV